MHVRPKIQNSQVRSFIPMGEVAMHSEPRYEVAISFANEDRDLTKTLVTALQARHIAAFYDQDRVQIPDLLQPLNPYLSQVFENEAKYCLVMLSQEYMKKKWPNIELAAAL